jgi:hypothetical protein
VRDIDLDFFQHGTEQWTGERSAQRGLDYRLGTSSTRPCASDCSSFTIVASWRDARVMSALPAQGSEEAESEQPVEWVDGELVGDGGLVAAGFVQSLAARPQTQRTYARGSK